MNSTMRRNYKELMEDSEDDFVLVENSNKKPEPKTVTPPAPANVATKVPRAHSSTESPVLFELKILAGIVVLFMGFFLIHVACKCAILDARTKTLEKEKTERLATISHLQDELDKMKELENQWIVKEAQREAAKEASGIPKVGDPRGPYSWDSYNRDGTPIISDPTERVFILAFMFTVSLIVFTILNKCDVSEKKKKKVVKTPEVVVEEEETEEEEQAEDEEEENKEEDNKTEEEEEKETEEEGKEEEQEGDDDDEEEDEESEGEEEEEDEEDDEW